MSTIGIVCGLEREARHFGKLGERDEMVAFGGIGEAAATRAARALVDAGASALVSWGLAGGLTPMLDAGSICLPQEVIGGDGTVISTTANWHAAVAGELRAQHAVSCGRLLSSSAIIASAGEKARAFRETGAVAVDMESLAVGQVALAFELPFLVLRVIVDIASDELPASALAAAQNPNPLRVAAALIRKPGELMALCRLAVRYRAAHNTLAAVSRVLP